MLKRKPKPLPKRGKAYSDTKKVRLVTKVLALGNVRLAAELENISYNTARRWRTEPWWPELEAEIKTAHKAQQDDKITRIINKALDTIEDRLDHGDVIWNQKTGEISRKPVSIKEARGAANDLMQRQVMYKKADVEEAQAEVTAVSDQLELLKAEFAKFQTGRTIEIAAPVVIDVTPKEPNAVHEEREA